MSKDYSKFKEKYLDSLDVDNVTGGQMIERTNCLECDEYNHEKYYCPIFCDVIRQTVNEMQGWIPIEEKEPTAGHVIVTVLWEKGVDTSYDDDYEVFEEDWWAMDDSPLSQRIKARTIAWTPMPKPYRGKEE